MVIVVNSVVGGAAVALVFALAVHAVTPVPVVAGIATGGVLLAAGLRYQHHRLTPVVLSRSPRPIPGSPPAGRAPRPR
jgi:hypothetical protein